MSIKKIGVLTSGGDAPGMNAALRSAVRFAIHNRLQVVGIMRGYAGLINGEIKPFEHSSVSNIISCGGTILKTDRCLEFMKEKGQEKVVAVLKKNKIDGLVLIGGDGTYKGGIELSKKWNIRCIGVPGTIDNDINGTDATIGSDTAVNTALDAIDKIRDTATSMERIFVVEVMGRDSGFIALQTAIGGGAEDTLIPERKFNIKDMCRDITKGNRLGKISWIIIVAEGAGKADAIAKKITDITSLETRVVVLGHVQRGGRPTAQDRILATRLGAEAVDLLIKGESGKAVGVIADKITVVDMAAAVQKKKLATDAIYKLIRILT